MDLTFTDPGDDVWAATVDWGDGLDLSATVDQDTKTVSISETFDDDASLTVEVCLHDGDGGSDCESFDLTVTNVVPAVALGSVPENLPVGVTDTLAGTFTDPGDDEWAASVDWGDGTTSVPLMLSKVFGATHSWSVPGSYRVEACISDDDGGIGCASATVDVLTAEQAVEAAVEDLQAASSDPAIAAALVDLDGASVGLSGALQKLEAGDYEAAVRKLLAAVQDLSVASSDQSAAMRLLTQIAESVARDRLAAVEALGLATKGVKRQIASIDADIAAGRSLYEGGSYAKAIDKYRSAVRKAGDLLK